MDRELVHETINQLVEAYHDEPQAEQRLKHFTATNERPSRPDQFPNLVAFLNFHDEGRRYDDTLQSLRTVVANIKEARKEPEERLLDILPENTPLHYAYEGSRRELAGQRFTIVNQHRTIMISSSEAPSR
jgi:hypothetical protein